MFSYNAPHIMPCLWSCNRTCCWQMFCQPLGGAVVVGAGSSLDILDYVAFVGNTVAYESIGAWVSIYFLCSFVYVRRAGGFLRVMRPVNRTPSLLLHFMLFLVSLDKQSSTLYRVYRLAASGIYCMDGVFSFAQWFSRRNVVPLHTLGRLVRNAYKNRLR